MAGQKILCLLLYCACLTWAELETTEHVGSERSKEMLEQLSTTEELVDLICSCRDNANSEVQQENIKESLRLTTRPTDCSDIMNMGVNESGRYDIYPFDIEVSEKPIRVWCDMETDGGGWSVIQRRQDGLTDFNRTWLEYRNGFGSVGGEFWLGNENIYLITNQRKCELRVDLQEWNGTRYSLTYEHFRIGDESIQYALNVMSSAEICRDFFPLGMEDGRIEDSQITASSAQNSGHRPSIARLNRIASGSYGGWRPTTDGGGQWIQVDLRVPRLVTGVILQGRHDTDAWVTKYKVQYSEDGNTWQHVKDENQAHDMVFDGNSDRNTPVVSMFASPVKASYVRIQPTAWQAHIGLRFELLGCEGDSLVAHHNYQPFSTQDVNNNVELESNCALTRGPWWYGPCDNSDLNAEYLKEALSAKKGVYWEDFQGHPNYLKSVEMKIRPVKHDRTEGA